MTQICVVGLGRIGLPTALAFQDAGLIVTGVDAADHVVQRLAARELRWSEPDLPLEKLDELTLTSRFDFDATAIDAWIVAVGTTVDGACDATPVERAVAEIAAVCRDDALVIIESTVPVGTCDALARRHPNVELASCPERSAPGAIVREIHSSPRLIGGVTARAARRAEAIYARLGCPLRPCSAREAELSKLAENAYRAVNVAFADELADVARSFEIDPFRLVELANSHPRVDILRPGLGAGGSCLPMALDWFADARPGGVSDAARAKQREIAPRVVERLQTAAPTARDVAVVGIAYKPRAENPPDEVDPFSPARLLLEELDRSGYGVEWWEPGSSRALDELISTTDAVVFGCAHAVFRNLEPPKGRGRVVLDPVGAVDLSRWSAAGWKTSR